MLWFFKVWAKIGMKESTYIHKFNKRKSVNGHRFPMPQLSRRGDKKVEMIHWLQGGQGSFISPHMDVHSVHKATSGGEGGGVRTDIRMYGCTDRRNEHTYTVK
jgi:hypothetical protein